MSKSFALAAFNTAVAVTNAAHAAKRGVVAGATNTKEASTAFWAGVKYANQYNKATGSSAARLNPEDIAPKAKRAARAVKA